MVAFVTPLLGTTAYEKIISGRPRGGEARIVFHTRAERDTFRATVASGDNPVHTDSATNEATKLYWNLPETRDDKYKGFVVRKLRDSLRTAHPNIKLEVHQRSGRIYTNEMHLLTVVIEPTTSEAKIRYVDRTLTALSLSRDMIDAMVRKADAE